MIEETCEYIVATTEDDAVEQWDGGEDVWDSEEDAWEDWIEVQGNKKKTGICFRLILSKKVEALPKVKQKKKR